MTKSLATCTPQSTIVEVARLMRDRNIGSVIVMEGGALCGVITDRDIVVRVLAAGEDPRHALVRQHMSRDIVTGQFDWDLDQLAEVMGEHQVRRLPIIEDNHVVGIVSMGDVARRTRNKVRVAESLREISGRQRVVRPEPFALIGWPKSRNNGADKEAYEERAELAVPYVSPPQQSGENGYVPQEQTLSKVGITP
jgi:predicted transcriptional regulator